MKSRHFRVLSRGEWLSKNGSKPIRR